jgi:hypothetical protein
MWKGYLWIFLLVGGITCPLWWGPVTDLISGGGSNAATVAQTSAAPQVPAPQVSGGGGGSATSVGGGTATVKSGKAAFAPESDFNVVLNDDGASCSIDGYTGPGGNIVIPATIQGKPVTQVIMNPPLQAAGVGEYDVNTTLISVVIPEGVKRIGGFYACIALRSVTLPASLWGIGSSSFAGCTGLASITIPDGVKFIGDSAFARCTSLTSVTIPNGVTQIGSAFSGCTNLVTVTISPVAREVLAYNAFSACPKLSLASQAAIKAAIEAADRNI